MWRSTGEKLSIIFLMSNILFPITSLIFKAKVCMLELPKQYRSYHLGLGLCFWYSLFVCVLICLSAYKQDCTERTKPTSMKLGGRVQHGERKLHFVDSILLTL